MLQVPMDLDEPRGTEPAELAKLLNDIRGVFDRFMVVSDEAKDMLALWVAHTYVFREFDVTPYLAIMSPTKRSGKTNLLTILEYLCDDAHTIVHTSTPALYEQADMQSTLLFDEQDMNKLTKIQQGVLHSGYKAGGSVTIMRNRKPRRINTYCPKAFASIGRPLSSTMLDRSIQVHIVRKRPQDQVERLRTPTLMQLAEDLEDRLTNYRAEFLMPEHDPQLPDALNDREYELWLPLFVIAEQAGAEWAKRCHAACLALTEINRNEETDETVLLLADIRTAFGGKNKLFSEDLLTHLRNLDESQYSGPATQSKKALAGALQPFGITPTQIRIGSRTKRGYTRQQFDDAFERFLP